MNYSQFLEAIEADPNSLVARIAFADSLVEMGDGAFADLVTGSAHAESTIMRLWSTPASESGSGAWSWSRSCVGSVSWSVSGDKTRSWSRSGLWPGAM